MASTASASVVQPLSLRQDQAAPSSPLTHEEHGKAKKAAQRATRPHNSHTLSFGVSMNEKIFFIDNLATMLTAGLSIADSLQTLMTEVRGRTMKRAIRAVLFQIENGGQLSEGLMQHPEVFPSHFISVIQVGEASGALSDVLTRLAQILKKDKALRSKVITAMIYPSIVVVAMIAIVIILMIYVFPQLISIFEEVEVELPLQTRVLIGVVRFMQSNGLYVGSGLIVLAALLIFGRKIRRVRYVYDSIFLRLPFVGNIAREVVLVRVMGNLQMLLVSGVPILDAFHIVSRTANNLVYEGALIEMANELEVGKSLHETMATRRSLFPTLAVTMVKVGEETGKIDEVMSKLHLFYEGRVDTVFGNLSTIIEPVLLLAIGVAVGFIAVSVIMPIYNLTQAF
ncbi:MAG: type II secretion system F family protein [Candidatus Komeilibacteria bacterium]|nr:type II secretion system F family protein [Candidatus Komeilibacteria bacterium]